MGYAKKRVKIRRIVALYFKATEEYYKTKKATTLVAFLKISKRDFLLVS